MGCRNRCEYEGYDVEPHDEILCLLDLTRGNYFNELDVDDDDGEL